MGTISLEGMHFFARHGCFEEERLTGTYYIVDVCFGYDSRTAVESDCIKDAIDYQEVYDLVKKEMDVPASLIEHVAGRIGNSIISHFPMLLNLKIKISKLNPALGGSIEKVSFSKEYPLLTQDSQQ